MDRILLHKTPLSYFQDKMCTIFTVQINRNFKEENPATYPQQMHEYFMGWVEGIDEYGIMLKQIKGNRRTYIFYTNIVSIAEEEVLYANNPEDAKIIDNFKTTAKEAEKELEKYKVETKDGPFVDIESLSKLSDMQKKGKR